MELEAALKESMKTFEAEDNQRSAASGNNDSSGGMVGSVLNRGGTNQAQQQQ